MKLEDAINDALQIIEKDIEIYNYYLEEALQQQSDYISSSEIELYKSGKKLRPTLLLLCARMASGLPDTVKLPIKILKASVSIEMLHVASLIHDDIIDEASHRRGLPSVHSARGIKSAVLIGDLQFIQSLRIFASELDSTDDFQPMRYILDIAYDLCIGEINELKNFKTFDLKRLRNAYFNIIERKTAQLFGIACEAPAIILQSPRKIKYYLHQFGLYFGRTFQIIDDLKDLLSNDMAKQKGNFADIYQKRFTLPIIEALKYVDEASELYKMCFSQKGESINMIKVIKQACNSKSLVETYNVARRISYEALAFLDFFPESKYKDKLIKITNALLSYL